MQCSERKIGASSEPPDNCAAAAAFPATDSERDILHAEQLAGLARQVVPSAFGNAAIALLVTLGLWGLMPSDTVLAGWAFVLCAISALRWWLLAPFRRPNPALNDPAMVRRALRLAECGAFAVGALWGFAACALVPRGNIEVMTFLALTVVAMSAASMVSLSARPEASRAYILASVLPLALRLALDGQRLEFFWAAMALLYVLVLLRFGRGLQETFVSALSGRVRSQRLAQELVDARGVLVAALENVDQGIMMIDAAGRVRVCNRQAADLLGLPTDLMATHPALQDVLRCEAAGGHTSEHTIGRIIEVAGVDQPQIYEHERANGTILEVRSTPIANGGAVRTISDVTAARRGEMALRGAEAEYRGLFENAVVGAYRATLDGRLLRANKALALMCGYGSVEALMDDFEDKSLETIYVEPARRQEFLERLLREGRVIDFVFEAKRRNPGEHVWVSHNARLIHAPDGRAVGTEGTVLDITARRTAEDAVARALAAEEANRVKSDFVANISHELRTPLHAIIGFSELFQQEVFGPLGHVSYQEYAGEILKGGRRLLEIVNDLLDLSKIEAGQMKLLLEDVDSVEIAEACRSALSSQAQTAGITLQLELGDLPLVRADQKRLRQILLNLVSNAIKFTPSGGTVTISGEVRGNCVSGIMRTGLVVTDTGVGMAPEQIETALQPFRQVDNSRARQQEGTGLGLPLARRLAELHGGTLELHSVPGRGTIATIWLPVETALPSPEIEADLPRRAVA